MESPRTGRYRIRAWRLRVVDLEAADVGKLNRWALKITPRALGVNAGLAQKVVGGMTQVKAGNAGASPAHACATRPVLKAIGSKVVSRFGSFRARRPSSLYDCSGPNRDLIFYFVRCNAAQTHLDEDSLLSRSSWLLPRRLPPSIRRAARDGSSRTLRLESPTRSE